jgi:hypothetical protein
VRSFPSGRIGELIGRIRDLEHDLPEDGVARTITENLALGVQVRQLTQDNCRLEERLAGARDTNPFLDKCIAKLEAELASPRPDERPTDALPSFDVGDAVELAELLEFLRGWLEVRPRRPHRVPGSVRGRTGLRP